jgi:hypothetical protein
VSRELIPVLQLCDPPGVGKTMVRWEIFSQLARAGIEAGYVNVDQPGMCIPSRCQIRAPPDKAHNLGAVVANFRSAGGRCVIVSGVVDAAYRVRADTIPSAALTVYRLPAGWDELRLRFPGRWKYRMGTGRAALP